MTMESFMQGHTERQAVGFDAAGGKEQGHEQEGQQGGRAPRRPGTTGAEKEAQGAGRAHHDQRSRRRETAVGEGKGCEQEEKAGLVGVQRRG
jgi:hypothetical protein